MRVRDIQSTGNARARDEELSFNSKADALKHRCDRLKTLAKAKEAGLSRDLKALEAAHHRCVRACVCLCVYVLVSYCHVHVHAEN